VYIEQCCPSLNHFSKSDTQGTMRHSVHGRWCSTKNVCLWWDPITMGSAMGSWLRGLEPLFYLELPFLSRSMQRVQSKFPLCFTRTTYDHCWTSMIVVTGSVIILHLSVVCFIDFGTRYEISDCQLLSHFLALAFPQVQVFFPFQVPDSTFWFFC